MGILGEPDLPAPRRRPLVFPLACGRRHALGHAAIVIEPAPRERLPAAA